MKSFIRDLKDALLPLAWVKRHLFSELEPPEVPIIGRMLGQNAVILDIGAHAGSWCINLSKRIPQAKIYSFEAFPVYSSALKMTCRLLGCRNIEVISSAIFDDTGLGALVIEDEAGDRLTGRNHLQETREHTTGPGSVSVNTTTIDEFWKIINCQKIDFIKLDIEGAELGALRGARNVLESCRPIIFCELVEEWCDRFGHTCADVIKLVEDSNYIVCLKNGEKFERFAKSTAAWYSNDALFIPYEMSAVIDKIEY